MRTVRKIISRRSRHKEMTRSLPHLSKARFFFSSRRQHTRLQGDWSSDVCSSDLLRFVRSCGKNGCFGFDFSKLFRADEAYAASRHVRSENPSDLFHLLLACQSPVFIECALHHRKPNFTLDKEESAKHFFLRGAKSLDDVPVATCPA